ncbi:ABC transporter substrate-binding protein [Microbacterium sp. LMI12-1-1.1]|uniref:ABC transporter substrate-binding protein n=1 Tax=unclassified Microbacterium TaxID=2609290 RepID=UPI00343D5CB9
MHSTRTALSVVGAAIAVLALAGCTTTTTTGSPDTSEAPLAEEQELIVGVQFPIEGLDPHGALSQDGGTGLAAEAIFSNLLKTTGAGEFEGELAESWESNEDASEWTFTLRDDIVFSDETPVTSEDVVASFERLLALAGPLAGNFKDYTVAAPDETTVVFTPPASDAALLGKLVNFVVTPADVDEASFSEPVGSGAFMVDEFVPGSSLRLVPNPNYWDGVPTLESLEMRTIPELAARITALQTGEIQAAWGMPDDQVTMLREDSGLVVETIPSAAVLTMWMNSSTPALADAEVRRALWQAVDFETIIASLFPETGSLADSPVAPNVLGYAPQEAVGFDPEAAKAALDEAGFDYSTVLRFQYSQPQFAEVTKAVASDLAEIGVQVEVLEKEQAVFLEDLLALNWDINIQQLGSAGFDAATNLGRLYTCAANRMGYCNPDLDELLAAAGSTGDVEEREALYADAIEIIWNDAVGMYPMFVETAYAWQSNVQGFEPAPDGRVDFSGVSIAAE